MPKKRTKVKSPNTEEREERVEFREEKNYVKGGLHLPARLRDHLFRKKKRKGNPADLQSLGRGRKKSIHYS